MLQALHIENIALIDKLGLDFGGGFNVLSGETGAGKSIIIDAVNFVLGERANRDIVKYGTEKARVEAVFDISSCLHAKRILDEQEIEYENDELILSRELNAASGKGTCRVNGALVPATMLKKISDALIDIHGQHEHQSLLSAENHISFLDGFANESISEVLGGLNAAYEEYASVRGEMRAGFGSEAEREREMDMLAYQIKEIASAKLSAEEEESLNSEKKLLMNAERIQAALDGAYEALSGDGAGALTEAGAARRRLAEIKELSPEYSALASKMDDAYYALEDVSYSLRDVKNALEFDAERLEQIEERLQEIADIKRKYGKTIEEALAFAKSAEERLEALSSAEERIALLSKKKAAIEERYDLLADKLGALRAAAASELREAVLSHLADLGLAKSDFRVELRDASGGEPRLGGRESAEFFLTTNPGEPLRPLQKVASGGVLSRIMLCFKAIFADNDSIDTLIFDEIDTGISGRVAAVVGEKMLSIASSHQVICVTHLPQIAALADAHYLVEKRDDGETTFVNVRELSSEEKIRRVAQMMDGDAESGFAIEHARQLIERGGEIKRKRG